MELEAGAVPGRSELKEGIGGIVEEELLGGGEPVAPEGDFALLAPVQDFLVAEAQVCQCVVGAGEGSDEDGVFGVVQGLAMPYC